MAITSLVALAVLGQAPMATVRLSAECILQPIGGALEASVVGQTKVKLHKRVDHKAATVVKGGQKAANFVKVGQKTANLFKAGQKISHKTTGAVVKLAHKDTATVVKTAHKTAHK